MCINDLSDNGKNFEFGYNSTNDSYGYYKNGTFTEFGGGGGMTPTFIVAAGGLGDTGGQMYFVCLYYTDGTVISSNIVGGSYSAQRTLLDNEYLKIMTYTAYGNWTYNITNYKECTAILPDGTTKKIPTGTSNDYAYFDGISLKTAKAVFVFEN